MADEKMMRLSQVARKLNVGRNTITDFLAKKGFEVDSSPNSKITPEQYNMLAKEFESSALDKEEASGLTIGKKHIENFIIDSDEDTESANKGEEDEEIFIKNIPSKKDAESPKPAEADHREDQKKEVEKQTADSSTEEEKLIHSPKLQGIKVVGKIDLGGKKSPQVQEQKPPTETDPRHA